MSGLVAVVHLAICPSEAAGQPREAKYPCEIGHSRGRRHRKDRSDVSAARGVEFQSCPIWVSRIVVHCVLFQILTIRSGKFALAGLSALGAASRRPYHS